MVYGLDWLIGSSPKLPTATPVRAKSTDGGYVAPDRNTRELCYESRDLFFECLDKHNILDANKEDALSRARCPSEVKDYERDCARSWVSTVHCIALHFILLHCEDMWFFLRLRN